MPQKILIFGNGQIGNFYENYFRALGKDVRIAKADIRIEAEVASAITAFKPEIVINTAAKTNLEYCGNNKEEAFAVNVLGADNIARQTERANAYFVHISSGCIFQSFSAEDVKSEDSPADPQSYYSLTKVWSEQIIPFNKSKDFKYLILRPRQPISTEISAKNMLIKMLTFQKYVDTPNTGTVVEDMMAWTNSLIEKNVTGIVNVANPGFSTPWQIAALLKEYILPQLEPEKISKTELDALTPNKRVDAVLSVAKLQSYGIEAIDFPTRLRETIIKLAENIKKADKSFLREIFEKTVAVTKQRSVANSVFPLLYEN